MATVLGWHGFDNKSKLLYTGEKQNEIIEWKLPSSSIIQNKRVRHARADGLELYSSIATLPDQ